MELQKPMDLVGSHGMNDSILRQSWILGSMDKVSSNGNCQQWQQRKGKKKGQNAI
jgi:hypothetical protein